MPKKWYKSEEIKVDYVCDECGEGKMIYLLSQMIINMDTGNRSYPHECQECGAVKALDELYPQVSHKPMTAIEMDQRE